MAEGRGGGERELERKVQHMRQEFARVKGGEDARGVVADGRGVGGEEAGGVVASVCEGGKGGGGRVEGA